VSDDQRVALTQMARSTTLPQRKVIEARGLVLAADGVPTLRVAKQLGVSPDRVRRWRARFERDGVAGIARVAPGRGRKPWLPAGTVAEIVRVTLEERPADGSTRWSTRTLAARVGVNRETVRRVWRDHGLKPWRLETFKLSNDPRFEEKLVDVVGLYLNPPKRAVVFSFDEKTQVQALDRTQPALPIKRGRAQTMTHDYKRHGTTDLFAALNLGTSEILTDSATRMPALMCSRSSSRSTRPCRAHSRSTSCSTTSPLTKRLRSKLGSPSLGRSAGSCTSRRPRAPG